MTKREFDSAIPKLFVEHGNLIVFKDYQIACRYLTLKEWERLGDAMDHCTSLSLAMYVMDETKLVGDPEDLAVDELIELATEVFVKSTPGTKDEIQAKVDKGVSDSQSWTHVAAMFMHKTTGKPVEEYLEMNVPDFMAHVGRYIVYTAEDISPDALEKKAEAEKPKTEKKLYKVPNSELDLSRAQRRTQLLDQVERTREKLKARGKETHVGPGMVLADGSPEMERYAMTPAGSRQLDQALENMQGALDYIKKRGSKAQKVGTFKGDIENYHLIPPK